MEIRAKQMEDERNKPRVVDENSIKNYIDVLKNNGYHTRGRSPGFPSVQDPREPRDFHECQTGDCSYVVEN